MLFGTIFMMDFNYAIGGGMSLLAAGTSAIPVCRALVIVDVVPRISWLTVSYASGSSNWKRFFYEKECESSQCVA